MTNTRTTGTGSPGKPHLPPDCATRYAYRSTIASGGFGFVYRAEHRNLGRLAAVKVLQTGRENDRDQIRRFELEARIAAKLNHPNVVKMLDFGAESGVPWIAYELVAGETLRAQIGGRGMAPAQALVAAIHVCRALEAAHSHGILHRDIKPENVLIDPDGEYKVTDFGIAKWTDSSSIQTESGVILGTPAYIAPEEVQGQPASAATDVYALGIMLFEMLTGELPFNAENPLAILRQHLTASIPLPSERRPGLTDRFDAIVRRALAKSPADRYQSASEILVDLDRVELEKRAATVALRAATSRPPPVPTVMATVVQTPKAAAKRWPALLGILGMAAILLPATGFLAGPFGPRIAVPASPVTPSPVTSPRLANPTDLEPEKESAVVKAFNIFSDQHDKIANRMRQRALVSADLNAAVHDAQLLKEKFSAELELKPPSHPEVGWSHYWWRLQKSLLLVQIECDWLEQIQNSLRPSIPTHRDPPGANPPVGAPVRRRLAEKPARIWKSLVEMTRLGLESVKKDDPRPSRWYLKEAFDLAIFVNTSDFDEPSQRQLREDFDAMVRTLAGSADRGHKCIAAVLGTTASLVNLTPTGTRMSRALAAPAIQQVENLGRQIDQLLDDFPGTPAEPLSPYIFIVGSAFSTVAIEWCTLDNGGLDFRANPEGRIVEFETVGDLIGELDKGARAAARWLERLPRLRCERAETLDILLRAKVTLLFTRNVAFVQINSCKKFVDILAATKEIPQTLARTLAAPQVSPREAFTRYCDVILNQLRRHFQEQTVERGGILSSDAFVDIALQLRTLAKLAYQGSFALNHEWLFPLNAIFDELAAAPAPTEMRLGQLLYGQFAIGAGLRSLVPEMAEQNYFDLLLVASGLNWNTGSLLPVLADVSIPDVPPAGAQHPEEATGVPAVVPANVAVNGFVLAGSPEGFSMAQRRDVLQRFYRGLLGRDVEGLGLSHWSGKMRSASWRAIAEGIAMNPEAHQHRARLNFGPWLVAGATDDTLKGLVGALATHTREQVLAGYLARDDVFERSGGKPLAYCQYLAAGLVEEHVAKKLAQDLVQALRSGANRAQLVLSVVRSGPARRRWISRLYQELTGRPPGQSKLAVLLETYRRAESDDALAVRILTDP